MMRRVALRSVAPMASAYRATGAASTSSAAPTAAAMIGHQPSATAAGSLIASAISAPKRWYRAAQSKKPTVVVIGTGWAGAHITRSIDPRLCTIVVLSNRNHMVFTPLLPQTCTGTLEFRSVCEPIIRVCPALGVEPNALHRSMVYDVDTKAQSVKCVAVGVMGTKGEAPVTTFDIQYDYLVLAHGARPNTFGIPGVEENAYFLREVSEARSIRKRLAQNIMTASLPSTTPEERARLLHVVIVGGGPTGVEFAGDLTDFLRDDIPKLAPQLKDQFQITLVEAAEVLGTFDVAIRKYGAGRLEQLGVKLRKAIVAKVTETAVHLKDGDALNCGLVVWSTGVGPSPLNTALKLDKNAAGPARGRLSIDDHCRVMADGVIQDNIFAVGDCAAHHDKPLPTIAAVASRQGTYVAKMLNAVMQDGVEVETRKPFSYKHPGSMASLGQRSALVDLASPLGRFDIRGLRAWLMWRGAYLTMLGSMRSRVYVFVNWASSMIFGRDVTYIAELQEMELWKSMAMEGAKKQMLKKAAQSAATEAPKVADAAKAVPKASKAEKTKGK